MLALLWASGFVALLHTSNHSFKQRKNLDREIHVLLISKGSHLSQIIINVTSCSAKAYWRTFFPPPPPPKSSSFLSVHNPSSLECY